MFVQAKSGLLNLFGALLCLWAAAYHTPVGALLRVVSAKVLGQRSSARPLLSYYSGGVWDVQRQEMNIESTPDVPDPQQLAAVPPGPALGRALFLTWGKLPYEQRRPGVALITRYGLQPSAFEQPGLGPDAATQLVDRCKLDLGSEDAAVLAFFAGFDLARYAAERTTAEGYPLTLERLAMRLPPDAAPALDNASQALLLTTAYGLSWPVPAGTRVTSPFGWRDHPLLGRKQLHTGVDLSVPEGSDVHATAAGTVTRVSEDAMNGKLVIIDHGRGVTTAYCHNSAFRVRVGQLVKEGDVVAASGNTGRSTGPHVHYQLELGHQPVDPLLFKGKDTRVALELPPPHPVSKKKPDPLKDAFDKASVPGTD
ncbi:MAG: M23 family metallopeptidase [Archangiaceae bacterium]|nr:M23 family metallopeptidase [Archangiaceae bacterium]